MATSSQMPEHWKNQDDVIISGIAGRFPDADNMAELEHKLMNGIDMISEDERRRPFGLAGLPRRHGKLNDLSKFDAQAFGVIPKLAGSMDPALRILHEVAYEAIADAGLNPLSMRGCNIGVFTGVSMSESMLARTDLDATDGYGLLGGDTTFYANRLSFFFGFTGPSFPINTACSSSLLALHIAMQNMRDGLCDAALVCGASLNLLPIGAYQTHKLNMTGADGACRAFDASGQGYVRSETVAAMFIQRKTVAHRIYATVVHTKTNSDGYKEQGITFPSGQRQLELLEGFYSECGVDPMDVSYMEAHGTGTPVGDPEEGFSITSMFCPDSRKEPLLLGSVKSNLGHAETAAGLGQIAKIVLAMERGYLPPNLHYDKPNPNIPGLLDGRLKVVAEKTAWKGGYAGINSFGFGGSNVHCLLKSYTPPEQQTNQKLCNPRLLCFAGRTEEAVQDVLKYSLENPEDTHLHSLLNEIAYCPPSFMGYRGCALITDDGLGIPNIEVMGDKANEKPPVWYIYSGMGSQWNGMGMDLMKFDAFRSTIEKCAAVLQPYQIDLVNLLTDPNVDVIDNTLNAFVSVVAVQIALTDILQLVGIEPDGMIGHSFGEVACGYADKCLTSEQCMLIAYWRGRCILEGNLAPGAMAAVGLTWEEAKKKCPPDVFPACHNASDSVTVSGPPDSIEKFVEHLQSDDVFAKKVKSTGVAFHSRYLDSVTANMKKKMQTVIVDSKPRSSRWVTTSVSREDSSDNLRVTASPEYYVNNLLAPVLFFDAVTAIPNNAIVIEVAPHSLLQGVIRRSVSSSAISVGLLNSRDKDQAVTLLNKLGKLYCSGMDIQPNNLVSSTQWPVPRNTTMIGPLLKWDHSINWPVSTYKDLNKGKNGAATSFYINPYDSENQEHKYLLDHVIDGKILFPMAGFMELAWKTLAKQLDKEFTEVPVVLEDVRLFRATNLKEPVTFDVYLSQGSPEFKVVEGTETVLTGKIKVLEEDKPPFFDYLKEDSVKKTDCQSIKLNQDDIYKQIRLRGYEYGPGFQGIYTSCNCGHQCELEWTGKWTAFIDSMTQTSLLKGRDLRHLLPIRLRYLRIEPQKHLKFLKNMEDNSKQLITCYGVPTSQSGFHCGGIELKELVVQSVPRRLPAGQSVFLNKKYFCPYYEDNCFKEFSEFGQALGEYFQKVSTYSKNSLARCIMRHSTSLPPSPPSSPVLTKKSTMSTLYDLDNDDKQYVIGKMLTKLVKATSNADQRGIAVNMLPELVNDVLWTSMTHPRALKPLIDFAVHNLIGKTINIAQLNAENDKFLSKCSEYVCRNPSTTTSCSFIRSAEIESKLEGETFDLPAQHIHLEWQNVHDEIPETVRNKQDLVVIEKLLYHSENPELMLQCARKLLSEQGLLLVSEITACFEVVEVIDFLRTFVNVEDENNNQKSSSQFLNHKEWCRLFRKCDLEIISYQQDPAVTFSTSYLLRPIRTTPRPVKINVDDVETFEWIAEAQQAVTRIANAPSNETVWLISNNMPNNGLNGLTMCLRDESQKPLRYRMIQDMRKPKSKPAPLSVAQIDERIKLDIVINIYQDDHWGAYVYIPMERIANQRPRLTTTKAFLSPIQPGNMSSLTWIESSTKYWEDRPTMFEKETMCAVYYGALNFKDVMLATGRLFADAIPAMTALTHGYDKMKDTFLFHNIDDTIDDRLRGLTNQAKAQLSGKTIDGEFAIGCEFSGKEMATGRRIMGTAISQSLATEIVSTPIGVCWDVPDHWTLEEAATVPIVYLTAYCGLIMRGKMEPGESILIHAGSGGVGQAAINIALSMNCEVFTTVGSVEKRKFLMNNFPGLKLENIGDSRSTSFESMIFRRTGGRGVDLVLNSLSDEKLQASIRCLANNGRFLEIGKFDLQNDTPTGMGILIQNVDLSGIVWDLYSGKKFNELKQMVLDGIKNGVVKPLNTHTFSHDKCEEAFRFMAQGKHIGKVLIKIRDEEPVQQALPSPLTVSAVSRVLPHPQHVYIITGGLGGFGLELADWLISRGATKVVLTSRSGIKTGYQARIVNSWKEKAVTVEIMKHNIANSTEATQMITDCQKLGPIGGIFHLAMVLRDALFDNQTVENFRETSQQKLWGTLNLDIATREKCSDMKWFVVFSSVASGHGHKGQTCYGWANCSMENIIVQRRNDGFNGQVIEWGAVGDVGVVLEKLGSNTTAVGGTLPQRIFSCMEAMELFLNYEHPVLSSFIKDYPDDESSGKIGSSVDLLNKIGKIFGVASTSELNPDARFGELGLDSLMGVEIREVIEKEFDIPLTVKDVRMLTVNKLKMLIDGDKSIIFSDKSSELEDKDVNLMQIYGLKFSIEDLMPENACVKLNNVEAESGAAAVFCVHSFEGVASNVAELASKFPNPFYCFQCTPSIPTSSIQNLASSYIQEMKSIQPEGPYLLAGYSFGVIIALEMAKQLQGNNEAVSGLVALDSSQYYPEYYRSKMTKHYKITANYMDTPMYQCELLTGFTQRFCAIDMKAFVLELLQMSDWNERLNYAADYIVASSTWEFKSSEIVKFTAQTVHDFYSAADRYDMSGSSLTCDICLIRAAKGLMDSTEVGNDYRLQEITTGKVSVNVVEGDHDSFLHDEACQEVVKLMSNHFVK